MKEWSIRELEALIHQAERYHNALVREKEYEKEFQVWGDESFSRDKLDAHFELRVMFNKKSQSY